MYPFRKCKGNHFFRFKKLHFHVTNYHSRTWSLLKMKDYRMIWAKHIMCVGDELAEWLRRWTANPLGSARMGSNPIFVAPPQWFYGVMVSTLDFESSDPSSNLGRTWILEHRAAIYSKGLEDSISFIENIKIVLSIIIKISALERSHHSNEVSIN